MGNGTHLGKVRGLGSSGHGSQHWLQQRLTALANILLVGFLFVSLIRLPLGEHGAVLRWASNPTVALALMLMVVSVFWHLRLGLTVLIEDYVHGEAARLFALVVLNFYAIGGGAFGLFAIARIAFAGGAVMGGAGA